MNIFANHICYKGLTSKIYKEKKNKLNIEFIRKISESKTGVESEKTLLPKKAYRWPTGT